MDIEYIGRCDMCGENLYDHDPYVEIPKLDIMVCADCSIVNYKRIKCDLFDLIEDSHLWKDKAGEKN